IPQIRLDAGKPLGRQLAEVLRRTILQTRLAAGTRLPATRQLAAALGVSRNTVLFAYDELAADGLVSGKKGSGTRVDRDGLEFYCVDPDGHALLCRGFRRSR